eukprot:gene1087-biopygen9461
MLKEPSTLLKVLYNTFDNVEGTFDIVEGSFNICRRYREGNSNVYFDQHTLLILFPTKIFLTKYTSMAQGNVLVAENTGILVACQHSPSIVNRPARVRPPLVTLASV